MAYTKCVASLCYDRIFFSAEEDKNRVVKNATAVKLSSIGKKKLFPLGGKCPGFSVSFGLRSQGYNYGNFSLPKARTEFSLTLKPLLTFIGLNQTLESQVMKQNSNLINTT